MCISQSQFKSKIQLALCLFHGSARDAMGVDHSRSHIAVSEQFLNSADVVVRLKQVRRKAVAEGMGCDSLCESCPPDGFIKRLLNMRLMKMIPSKLLLIRKRRKRLLRKEPLPYEILRGFRIFLFEPVI